MKVGGKALPMCLVHRRLKPPRSAKDPAPPPPYHTSNLMTSRLGCKRVSVLGSDSNQNNMSLWRTGVCAVGPGPYEREILSSLATSADGWDPTIISSAGKNPGKRNWERSRPNESINHRKRVPECAGRQTHTTHKWRRRPPLIWNSQLLRGAFLQMAPRKLCGQVVSWVREGRKLLEKVYPRDGECSVWLFQQWVSPFTWCKTNGEASVLESLLPFGPQRERVLFHVRHIYKVLSTRLGIFSKSS